MLCGFIVYNKMMSKISNKILLHLPSVLGMSFCLVWVFMASHHLSISLTIAAMQDLSARSVLMTGTLSSALLLLFLLRKNIVPGKRELGLSAVLMSVGFLLFALPETLEVPVSFSLLFIFLSGFGYGILFMTWMFRIDFSHTKKVLMFFGSAIFIASLLDTLLIKLPLYLILVIMLCLPPASAALCSLVKNSNLPRAPKQAGSTKLTGSKVILIVLPLFVEGFAYGASTQLIFYLNDSLENVVGVFALMFTGLLLLASGALLSRFLKHKGLLLALAITLVLGYSSLPFLADNITLVVLILMLSYNFFYFLVLAFCGVFSKRLGLSLAFCLTVVVLALSTGDAIGSVFVGFTARYLQPNYFYIAMSYLVFLSFVISVFVVAQYLLKPHASLSLDEERFLQQVNSFASKSKLSKRETEVLTLLVKGRSAQVVAEKLFISPETVRAHTKSIYKKAEVHSQQDLIDSFENFENPQ